MMQKYTVQSKNLRKVSKESSMPKEDCLELEGVVVDIQRDDIKIKLSNDVVITGYLAGKLRINNIRILVGDKVKVEMSPYDLTRGRITWRAKN